MTLPQDLMFLVIRLIIHSLIQVADDQLTKVTESDSGALFQQDGSQVDSQHARGGQGSPRPRHYKYLASLCVYRLISCMPRDIRNACLYDYSMVLISWCI